MLINRKYEDVLNMRKIAKVCICGMAAAVLLTGCSKKAAVDPTTAEGTKTETTAEGTTEAGSSEAGATEAGSAEAGTTAEGSTEAAELEKIEGLTLGADEDKVVLGEYKGIEVAAIPVEDVTDEELDQRVQYVLSSNTITDVPADHVAKNGDTVNIDYVGKKDGVAFDGGTAQGQDLKLGSGSFITGFEEGLVGAKAGDKKNLHLTFPENYGQADLAGKDVVFEVTVNSFTSIVPEFNDEFVAAHSETSKNVDEYEEELREQIAKEKEASALLQKKQAVFTEVLNNSEVFVSDKTLDEEYNRQLLSQTNQAQAYGLTIENLASMYGMDMPTFQSQLRQMSAQMVRQDLVIDAVAKAEGITLTDAEKEEIAQEIGLGSVANMQSMYGDVATESFLLTEKVAAFLADNAVEK
ncbi:MAG: trigger factor [Clostridiaceae bacterium]|nr:trigger factor [Clostridiaceae bacterium]